MKKNICVKLNKRGLNQEKKKEFLQGFSTRRWQRALGKVIIRNICLAAHKHLRTLTRIISAILTRILQKKPWREFDIILKLRAKELDSFRMRSFWSTHMSNFSMISSLQ